MERWREFLPVDALNSAQRKPLGLLGETYGFAVWWNYTTDQVDVGWSTQLLRGNFCVERLQSRVESLRGYARAVSIAADALSCFASKAPHYGNKNLLSGDTAYSEVRTHVPSHRYEVGEQYGLVITVNGHALVDVPYTKTRK